MIATRTLQPAQPLAADGAALARILQQAGLTKASIIRITGPAGLTAALWLCRHGYEHAAYIHANWVGAMGSVDALIAPHACASEDLAALLQSGEGLRAGAVVIVQVARDCSAQGLDSPAALLDRHGYQLEHRLSDKGREVFIARRRQPEFKKAA
jgi:hypothetical protein